jgi:hypothetical protein
MGVINPDVPVSAREILVPSDAKRLAVTRLRIEHEGISSSGGLEYRDG